jgi:acyl-CoA thioesterase I
MPPPGGFDPCKILCMAILPTVWAGLALLLVLGLNAGLFGSPESRRILVLGDSLAAGYGTIGPAFPAVLQEKIAAAGLDYAVVNAGVSGDTTAGGLGRIDWLLRSPVDVLVLELGANDGLRGIPLDSTKRNLQSIIDRTRARYPEVRVVIAGMLVPPNLGPDYTRRFREIFEEVAAENAAALIPFLLAGVAGRPELNLPDGIHPTPEGHRIMAENVWKVLGPLLEKRKD